MSPSEMLKRSCYSEVVSRGFFYSNRNILDATLTPPPLRFCKSRGASDRLGEGLLVDLDPQETREARTAARVPEYIGIARISD